MIYLNFAYGEHPFQKHAGVIYSAYSNKVHLLHTSCLLRGIRSQYICLKWVSSYFYKRLQV